jgi:exopolyphosphatase/guanosine-5'-triphosphate,3'-diphosphate pyrophosphatase
MSFEPFATLAPTRRERVLKLIALLRVADGLDRSHNGTVDAIDVKVEPKRVRLVVRAENDIDLELWGLRRKRELFERVFELPLDLRTAENSDAF